MNAHEEYYNSLLVAISKAKHQRGKLIEALEAKGKQVRELELALAMHVMQMRDRAKRGESHHEV